MRYDGSGVRNLSHKGDISLYPPGARTAPCGLQLYSTAAGHPVHAWPGGPAR